MGKPRTEATFRKQVEALAEKLRAGGFTERMAELDKAAAKKRKVEYNARWREGRRLAREQKS